MDYTLLTSVMRFLRNDFARTYLYGTFEIKDGKIDIPERLDGQFYGIIGSVFNDGVHNDDELTDETFEGKIVLMAIPKGFLSLMEQIEDFQKAQIESGAYKSPFTSESFGGYSYSKKKGGSGGNGGTGDSGYGWQDEFMAQLAMYRKI